MKKKLIITSLTTAMLVLSVSLTKAVLMTTFPGWPELIQDSAPDIVVVRCLKTPNPDFFEEPDSWDLSYNEITNFASLAKNLRRNPIPCPHS
jgi:hypothetical protein